MSQSWLTENEVRFRVHTGSNEEHAINARLMERSLARPNTFNFPPRYSETNLNQIITEKIL